MILTVPTGSDPFSVQRSTFEGVTFVLSLAYNTRVSSWYLSVADANGVDVVNGVKLICSMPLLRKCADPRAPAGDLFVLSASADTSPPGLSDLLPSGRCTLLYMSSDWLDQIALGNASDVLDAIAQSNAGTPSSYGADAVPLTVGTNSLGGVVVTSNPPGPRGKAGLAGPQGLLGLPGPQGPLGPSGVGALPIVALVGPGTLAAAANTEYTCDVSAGAIVLNLPALGADAGVRVTHVNGNLGTYGVTVNAPGGIQLRQLPPNNGTNASTIVFNQTWQADFSLAWWNFGVAAVYNVK